MAKLTIDDPYTGETVAERELTPLNQVDALLDQMTVAAKEVATLDVEARARLCTKALESMLDRADRIAADITAMMGKPIAQAQGELRGLEERARHMIAIAPTALADVDVGDKEGFERRIERVPLGVVFNLPAWNYPLLTCVNVVIPAVLAGNAVLLKHSARTALCGEHFADAFVAAGAPEGAVTALHCDHDVAGAVAADRRVGYVGFTGSVTGGHAIYRAVASHHFSDCGLELGGKDAAYVAEDADLAQAIDGLVDGACYNAGQSCCGVERVYVHEARYDDFIAGARSLMEGMNLGDPRTAVDMGPMAQPHAPAFIEKQLEEALAAGAERLVGGAAGPIDGKGRFVPPTLLVGVDHTMAVMREETFGPVLPVVKVKDDEEALRLANDSDLGLTASIWTKDRDRAAALARRLEVGTVYMNRCDVLDPALPWTGVKDTGKGATLSSLGFLHLTRPRSIHFRL